MKIKRICLIVALTLLFSICFYYMNVKFDRLSRYPYEGEKMREIISENLTDEEIEYIIQYSIAPVHFMDYIECPSFNIYHIDQYNHTKDIAFYLSNEEVVEYTEQAMLYNRGLDLIDTHGSSYHYSEILFWLENGDLYAPDSILIKDPNSVIAHLNATRSMSNRHPFDLATTDVFNTEVLLRETAIEPLNILCADLKKQFGGRCGGVDVESSFISYESQVELYKRDKSNELPGHSEHQLGLALDFKLSNGKEFVGSKQYEWLLLNAHNYGYIQSYSELNELRNHEKAHLNHFRYVGENIANKMFENNLTFAEALK